MHYGIALRSVKQNLVNWSSKEKDDILILLTASLLLCPYEVCLTFPMAQPIVLRMRQTWIETNVDGEGSVTNC